MFIRILTRPSRVGTRRYCKSEKSYIKDEQQANNLQIEILKQKLRESEAYEEELRRYLQAEIENSPVTTGTIKSLISDINYRQNNMSSTLDGMRKDTDKRLIVLRRWNWFIVALLIAVITGGMLVTFEIASNVDAIKYDVKYIYRRVRY